MNFIKRNRNTIIAISVFLIVLILLIQVKNVFFPNETKAIYGTRLEGIEKVKITNNKEDQVKEAVKEGVSKTSIRVSGRIVNIILTVNSDISLETAKGYASQVIEPFTDKQLKYYDFQVFIKKEEKTADFPIIGYKHHNKENFTWTKDRTGTE